MKKLLRPLLVIVAMVLALALAPSAPEASRPTSPADWVKGWSGVVNYYKASMGKTSLDRRGKGMITLAATRDKRAITLLADRYAKAEEPADYVRCLTIWSCMRYMTADEHLKSMQVWAGKHKLPRDLFLKFRVWELTARKTGNIDEAMAVARNEKENIWIRAAACEAIGNADGHVGEKLDLVVHLLSDKDAKKPVKKLFPDGLMRVCAASLLSNAGATVTSEKFEPAFEAVITQLDIDKTARAFKLMVSRHLRELFDSDRAYINAAGWRRVLHGEREALKGRKGGTAVRKPEPAPSFAGIPSNGDRFAYVIDISDSMLKPVKKPVITPEKKPKGPITGRSKGKNKKKKKKKDDPDSLPSEKDLDWKRIKNRFHLAREYLRISLLRTLAFSKFKVNKDREMYFTIIFFNEEAKYFKSTNGLVKMTKGNVQAALKELDAIKSKPSGKADRPHGTLSEEVKGYTNMHGGIRRAFAARPKGVDLKEGHCNPKLFADGVDTVFLLSDGAPSYSDFIGTDDWEKDVIVGDPETGTKGAKADNIQYHGPYSMPDGQLIVDDLARLNIVRTVEVHCIGIGEAPGGLLSAIANNNYGKTKFLGN